MGSFTASSDLLPDIRVGARGFLVALEERHAVTLIEVSSDTILTSLPGMQCAVEGLAVCLEFHDVSGLNCYDTRVVGGPLRSRRGLLLERPRRYRRLQHRVGCRVPTDLTVQVRDVDSLRCYDAALLDISSGGGLLETRAPLREGAMAEATLSLPEEPMHRVTARVVHVQDDPGFAPRGARLCGLSFLEPAPDVRESILRYTRRQLEAAGGIAPPSRVVMHIW